MDCGECGIKLVPQDNLCFFYKRDKFVELMIKYEQTIFFEDKFTLTKDKREQYHIHCWGCNSKIGTKHCFGPNHADVMAFGQGVFVLGRKLERRDRWYNLYQDPPYNVISIRYITTFYGYPELTDIITHSLNTFHKTYPINWPLTDDISHFTYDDVIMSDVIPRDYQITAYIEALQNNLVLVLPTGYGKTLVASMTAARMKRLNPHFMVLFVVDRIPLVFQQAESISTDTHLNVCPITSEFNTNLKRKQLNQGYYDVLVSTAGAYLALEREVKISKFCLVVIDECHHATKSHDYVILLKMIGQCDPRPRVLGLTASPPSTKGNVISTKTELDKFREVFFNAPICHNLCLDKHVFADAKIIKQVISKEPLWELREYQERLERKLYLLANAVNSCSPDLLILMEDWKQAKNRIQLLTMLYHLKLKSDVVPEGHLKSMMKICDVMEITEFLGITDAHKLIEDIEGLEDLNPQKCLSPRVDELFSILNQLPRTSKIIVFVKTRRMAHMLTNILKEDYSINKKYSPLKIVGQSGPFGMNWLNEQDAIIEKFRNGNCNILVSTSVLEEGIDNPDCDVVIRFDGVKSLISFTQSKGRARKWVESKFFIIISQDELAFTEEIESHEKLVKEVLTNSYDTHNEIPSAATRKIQEEIAELEHKIPPLTECFPQSFECVVEFYLSGSHQLFHVQDRIADYLFTKFFLKVKLIDQADCNSQWKSKHIFPPADSLLVLGLQTLSPNIYQRYKLLSVGWSFYIHKVSKGIWTRIILPRKRGQDIDSKWPLRSISWGKFRDKQIYDLIKTYRCESDISNNGRFELFPERCIKLSLPHLVIEIPFASIHRFILTNWTKDDVTLYIPLIHCPSIRKLSGQRMSCDDCEILSDFANSPVIGITLLYTKSNWGHLWLFLHYSSIFPVPVFESRVEIDTHLCETVESLLNHPLFLDCKPMQDTLWKLNVLRSRRDICLPDQTISKILSDINESNEKRINCIGSAISFLLSRLSINTTYYFFDLYEEFTRVVHKLSNTTNPCPSPNLARNFCFIEYAMVTPATVIPSQPLLTQCNRLYRTFYEERFLNLSFRDEHGEMLNDSDFMERVKRIIKNGIIINGLSFHFLVCSNSQLRSRSAIFIQVTDPGRAVERIQRIRDQLIGKSVITSETQYLSRIGLFCTSDYPIVKINECNTLMLPDLFAENGGNLTDGNGKILKSIATKVFDRVKLKNNPTTDNTSAIQIRLAGLKGVLTIVEDETDRDFKSVDQKPCFILYRQSMKKIEWTDSMLCVVKVGKFNRLFLNIQMLTLLTSLKDTSEPPWDPKPRLREIFSKALENNAKLFTDLQTANFALISNLQNYSTIISEQFDILSEPYFISLLRCIYTHNVKKMAKRFHIPIEHGCILMGIADPTGVLEDGQVYITYQESSDSSIERKTGRVLVYKNPCLHPGDLLTPTAVDKKELHNLHNVIVFPITGRVSLPACSGGGDLDGDEFAVIWDKDIVPTETATISPLDYERVLQEYKQSLVAKPHNVAQQPTVQDRNIPFHLDTNIQSILAQSYCRLISNNQLGIISHYHVAISDMQPDGARDSLAIELAKLASLAVDAAKTNVFPTIPDKAKSLINERGYPDFMEKTDNTSYLSKKLLGELYQSARAVCFGLDGSEDVLNYHGLNDFRKKAPGNLHIDVFKIPGYEKHEKDAEIRYLEYETSLRAIMLSLGIETEAEVMLCLVLSCHPLLSVDRGKVTRTLEAATTCLVEEFREKFYRGTPEDEYLSKAAAWYIKAYEQQQDVTFLSFPWIVGEELCKIARMYKNPVHMTHNLHLQIGTSAREYISRNNDNILNIVEEKKSMLPKIHSVINKYAYKACNLQEAAETNDFFKIEAYGSVTKYLCELQSDLDVCVSLTEFGINSIPESDRYKELDISKQRRHILKSFISPPLGDISCSKSEKFTGFPYLNCKIDSQDERCTEISVDITVQSDGVLKADYILRLYRETGGVFFGFLWLLIHWARHVGILKCRDSEDNTSILITAQFEALVLHIYSKMTCKPNRRGCEIDTSLYFILCELKDPTIDKVLGLMLVEFFWLGYKITSSEALDLVYTWPIKDNPTHTIRTAALRDISVLLFQAWHCIVYTRDISKLFDQSRVLLSFSKRFSTFMSNYLRTSTHFLENTLYINSGAQIHIDVRDQYVHLTAHGPASAIHKLSKEVSLLESNTALTKSYKSTTSHYILEGSLALVMSNYPNKSKVTLTPFDHGLCRDHHYRNNKNFLISFCNNPFDNWRNEGRNKIQRLLCNQLSHFPRGNKEMLCNLKLITRFGYFYILEGLGSFHNIGSSIYLEEFEKCLLKGRFNRKFDSVEESINILDEYLRKLEIQPSLIQHVPDLPPEVEPRIPKIDSTRSGPLTCAFCPGIKQVNSADQLKSSKSVFMKSLEQCGFTKLDKCKRITWMICIQMTINRSVRIILDEHLKVIDVGESPLVWMMATIVADRNILNRSNAHDVRLRTESSIPLDRGSNFFQMIFPEGMDSPILTVNDFGFPTLTDHLNDKLMFLKHYHHVEFFQLNSTIAKLTTGIEFTQQNLDYGRNFCELSLYHNQTELKEAVQCSDRDGQIQVIAGNAVDESLKLSEVIYNNMD